MDKQKGFRCDQTVHLVSPIHCGSLSRRIASHQFPRSGKTKTPGLPHQQFSVGCGYGRSTLQISLAGRTLFQMDQAKPPHQIVLRHDRERRKSSNLDRGRDLFACRDHEKNDEPFNVVGHDSPSFKRHTVRENTFAGATLRDRHVKCGKRFCMKAVDHCSIFNRTVLIWFHRWANPVYYDRIMHACVQGGLKTPRIVQQAGDHASILSLVACRLGVAFVSETTRWHCPRGVTLLPVVDLDFPAPFYLIWRKDDPSALLQRFVAQVETMLRSSK